MYDIYIGKPEKEIYERLYSFPYEKHKDFFEFIDKNNLKDVKMLNEIRDVNEFVNFSISETLVIKKELEIINQMTNMDFSISLEKACIKALETNLDLICAGGE